MIAHRSATILPFPGAGRCANVSGDGTARHAAPIGATTARDAVAPDDNVVFLASVARGKRRRARWVAFSPPPGGEAA